MWFHRFVVLSQSKLRQPAQSEFTEVKKKFLLLLHKEHQIFMM